jgi:hypothetical protein
MSSCTHTLVYLTFSTIATMRVRLFFVPHTNSAALNAHSMFTQWALNVLLERIDKGQKKVERPMNAHWMLTQCSLNVH